MTHLSSKAPSKESSLRAFVACPELSEVELEHSDLVRPGGVDGATISRGPKPGGGEPAKFKELLRQAVGVGRVETEFADDGPVRPGDGEVPDKLGGVLHALGTGWAETGLGGKEPESPGGEIPAN